MQKYLQQLLAPEGLAVIGVEVFNGTSAQIDTFIQKSGATFPVAMKGYTVCKTTYGLDKNYILLVDRDGVIRDISQIPASVTYSQIDTIVKEVAAKARVLLAATTIICQPTALRNVPRHPPGLWAANGRRLSRATLPGTLFLSVAPRSRLSAQLREGEAKSPSRRRWICRSPRRAFRQRCRYS